MNDHDYGLTQGLVDVKVVEFLEPGHWFVSLYNDDGDPQEVSCVVSMARDMALSCPRRCNDNGECILGRCQCKSGFAGDDCSQSQFSFVIVTFIQKKKKKFKKEKQKKTTHSNPLMQFIQIFSLI